MGGAVATPDAGVRFERAEAQDLETGLTREWLLTNGLGGYASSTIPGVNTRQYHALLVAATEPPTRRVALLARLNGELTVGEEVTEIMTSEYGDGTIFPDASSRIESFALEDGLPTWHFRVGDTLLRRTLWMIPGHNITVARYKLAVGREPVELALRPLCAARDHHHVQHGDWNWQWSVETVKDGAMIRAGGDAPPLWLLAPGADFLPAGDWYWRFLLREEQARGYEHLEDLFQPGTFRATLRPGGSLTLIASAEEPGPTFPDPDAALARRRSAHAHAMAGAARGRNLDYLAAALTEAADQFVVWRRPAGSGQAPGVSLLAGYPWFTDYGRDAMIALPGILLTTGRAGDAAALLTTFAGYAQDGLIPNQFSDTGEAPDYNAVDASLLFILAAHATLEAGVDGSLLATLYPTMREIIAHYTAGTRHGIGVDPEDGLLRAGRSEGGTSPIALTWMNATLHGHVYTPRIGKPVEVNAFWIRALALMAEWAPAMGDDPAPYIQAGEQARIAFAERFWFAEGGYLYDLVDGPDGDDPSLRPNQLFALGLVPRAQARQALATVNAQLLTPFGIRTLSPRDPRYIGQCVGDQGARDSAYHQGTVWPWLLGPYVDACRAVLGEPPDLEQLLEPFIGHLREAGLGTISQIFDGDPPHTPRGAIAQAWSVGELLRLIKLGETSQSAWLG